MCFSLENPCIIVYFCIISAKILVTLISAEWVLIGGRNYDFNPGPLSQNDAKARCIRMGGKLFEPKDKKTNRDVFVQAGNTLSKYSLISQKLYLHIFIEHTDLYFQHVFKVIHPNYYKHLKEGAHQRNLGRQKIGWFLADYTDKNILDHSY